MEIIACCGSMRMVLISLGDGSATQFTLVAILYLLTPLPPVHTSTPQLPHIVAPLSSSGGGYCWRAFLPSHQVKGRHR
jgi:hypothetical protein